MPPCGRFLLLFLESINKCNSFLLVSIAINIHRGSPCYQSQPKLFGTLSSCKRCSETENREELITGTGIVSAGLVVGVPSPYQPNFHRSLFPEPVLMNFGITLSSR